VLVPDGDGPKKELSDGQKRHQIKRIQKKRKKNTVSFRYNVKIARIAQKKDWGTWLSSMFTQKRGSSIKDLAHAEHVPEQEGCPKNEYRTTVQAG